MRVGIIVAITRELKVFLESGHELKEINEDNRIVYECNINGQEIYAIKSGFGQIDAASATQYLITKYNVEAIFNFGVTGALVKGLNVHDLFIARGVINSDYDVSEVDPVKKHQYEEFEDEVMPLDGKLIDAFQTINSDIKECVVASGEKFVAKLDEKLKLAQMGCQICDMELAAIVRTSFLNRVPCLSIKCISDSLEGSDVDFNANVSRAANIAFKAMEEFLIKIK